MRPDRSGRMLFLFPDLIHQLVVKHVEHADVVRLPRLEPAAVVDDDRVRAHPVEGISLDALALRLGSAYLDALLNGASHYITDGLLAVTDGRLHLTRRGIYVSDMVMADLVLVDE